MRRRAAAAAAAAALLAPAPAWAHATLAGVAPGRQARVEVPPAQVVLLFSEPVLAGPGAVRVLAPGGRVLSRHVAVSPDGRVVTVTLAPLRRGEAYTVRWRVTGRDGHSPSGVYTFGVGVAPPPPTEAVGAGGTTWRDDLARWLLFAALALLLGPLAVRLSVLRGPLPAELERRFDLVAVLAAFAVIDAGLAAFVIRASNALQLPLGELWFGDLQPFAEQTRFGVAFLVMTVGFAVVAALLVLAWVLERARLRAAALALGLGLASGLSLSGHQATEENASLAAQLADWVHLVAACVWVGGLAALALLVWPAAPGLRRKAFLGFSRLAVGLVAAMAGAGAYLALVRLPELADLWETGYGRTLLLKLAAAALALGWGAVHLLVVRPRLATAGAGRLRRSLLGELAAAALVLLAAAALTNAAPPRPAPGPTPGALAGP